MYKRQAWAFALFSAAALLAVAAQVFLGARPLQGMLPPLDQVTEFYVSPSHKDMVRFTVEENGLVQACLLYTSGFRGNCAHFYPQTAARGDETGENGYPTMGTCCDVPACLLRPSLYGTLSAQHILAGTCLYHVPPGRRLPCGGGGRAHHRRPLLNIKGLSLIHI